MCPERVMNRAAPIAPGDLVPQVRRRDVCAEPLVQCRFWVSPSAPTLLAGDPNEVAGMFAEGERAVHGVKGYAVGRIVGRPSSGLCRNPQLASTSRSTLTARREAPPCFREGTRADKDQMVASLGAPSPSLCRGVRKRDGRQACPGPRQRIRVMTHVSASRRALLFDN